MTSPSSHATPARPVQCFLNRAVTLRKACCLFPGSTVRIIAHNSFDKDDNTRIRSSVVVALRMFPGGNLRIALTIRFREPPRACNPMPSSSKGIPSTWIDAASSVSDFCSNQPLDFLALVDKIVLTQKAAEVVKHRADKDLFNIAWRGLLADILGQNCRQVGAQEFLLEVACITLVLQVFESMTVIAMLRTASKPSTRTAREIVLMLPPPACR